jgi:excisionase family DNA binding protein
MSLLTVKELEADSKISRFTWRAWIRQGRVPVIRAGRRVRVAEEDYRAFLSANRLPARVEGGR